MRPVMNLDDSLQDLSEAMQRRLVVLDEQMRVLAYSIHESEADRGRLSYLLAHSDSWEPLPAGADAPAVRDAGSGGRWVLAPLRDHRHRVGYLVHHLAPGEELSTKVAALLAEGLSDWGCCCPCAPCMPSAMRRAPATWSPVCSTSVRRRRSGNVRPGRWSGRGSSAARNSTASSSSGCRRTYVMKVPGRRARRSRRPWTSWRGPRPPLSSAVSSTGWACWSSRARWCRTGSSGCCARRPWPRSASASGDRSVGWRRRPPHTAKPSAPGGRPAWIR